MTASRARMAARVEVHRLVQAAQDRPGPGEASIRRLGELGDRNRWPEVAVVAELAAWLSDESDGASRDAIVAAMCRRAEASQELALISISFALRSSSGMGRTGNETVEAGRDLAKAIVCLERAVGGSLERLVAHNACGIALSAMGLWELELAQYEVAASIDPIAEEPLLTGYERDVAAFRRPIIYNRVELETSSACSLHGVGDGEMARTHAESALLHLAEAKAEGGWPATWVAELEACGLLARALVGENVSDAARAIEATADLPRGDHDGVNAAAEAMRVGDAQLALALSLGTFDRAKAAEAAEAAVATLAVRTSPQPLMLALELAAQLEGAPAGCRLVAAEADALWSGRQRDMEAMEAHLDAERWRARCDELERHANSDELTGLANRRGLHRHVNDLVANGRSWISLLVIDIDSFDELTARHGQDASERAMRRLAGLLSAEASPGGLVARVGGEEFLVVLDDGAEQLPIGVAQATAALQAQAIAELVAARSSADADAVPFTVSTGVASGAPSDFERLLAEADLDMYRSRRSTARRRRVVSPRNE